MNGRIFLIALMVFTILISLSCAKTTLTSTSPGQNIFSSAAADTANASAMAEKEARELRWGKILSAALKEGRVVILAGGSQVREPLSRGFKERFGIEVEFIIGRGDEQVQRIFTERRAGIYYNDVYVSSPSMMVIDLKPGGALDPFEPALILPEVTDPKYWRSGKLPWFDKDHYVFQFIGYSSIPLGINTNLVKPEDIKSYRDFLAPQWKEKISINDPTVSGSGNNWFVAMLSSGKLDIEYFQKLVEQKPAIIRDQRLQLEWLARGRYPIAITPKSDVLAQFEEAGAPVKGLMVQEGTYLTAGGGVTSLFNRAPHPNAAIVFINWLLSKEGVTIFSRARGGEPSLRTDVSSDFLDPIKILQPGVEYFRPTEEYYLRDTVRFTEVARELFKPLLPQ